MQKVTFAFSHTCTRYLPVLGGPNRKSATFHTFCTLALPNRPSRTFAYVYDVFARSGSPKTTFGAFGAYLVKSRSPGRRTLNRGGPPRGGAGRGGFPTLPLSSRTLLSLVDRTAPQPSPDGCGAETRTTHRKVMRFRSRLAATKALDIEHDWELHFHVTVLILFGGFAPI